MVLKKPFYKYLVGLSIIVLIVLIYLYFKFNYYEETVRNKVAEYNEMVEIYYRAYESLDSIRKQRYDKTDYTYISDITGMPEEYGSNYKGYIKQLDSRILEIGSIIRELEVLKAGMDSLRKAKVEFELDAPLTTKDTTIDEDLLYSTEEIHGMYQDKKDKQKNLMKKKQNTKDAKVE